MRNKGIKCQFAPVGDHHSHGLVESKIRGAQRMIGSLNLELHPMSVIEFQTVLLQIAEMMNVVPLGVTLKSHDPASMLVTPNKLLGKINERRPLRPISVPADMTGILRENKERWQTMAQVFSTVVFPSLVKNTKFHQDSGTEFEKDSIVLFRKKQGSNFVKKWSIAKVLEVYRGSDNKIRSALIEYRGSKDDSNEIEQIDITKMIKRTTTRDMKDLIPLFPVCSSLDADLRLLHYEILNADNEKFRQEILEMQNNFKDNRIQGDQFGLSCLHGECEHGNKIDRPCSICELKNSIDQADTFKFWISKGEDIIYSVQYRGHHHQMVLKRLSETIPDIRPSSDVLINRSELEDISYKTASGLGSRYQVIKPFSFPVDSPNKIPLADVKMHHSYNDKELCFPLPSFTNKSTSCQPNKQLSREVKTLVEKYISNQRIVKTTKVKHFGWKHIPWHQYSTIITRAIQDEESCTPDCCCNLHCQLDHHKNNVVL